MATDKKDVQNQKVFIHLTSVVELANEYNRTITNLEAARRERGESSMSIAIWAARKQALEFAIETLGLPISRRS